MKQNFSKHFYIEQQLNFLKYILLTVFLVSCSTMEKPVSEDLTLDQTGVYKFDAWRLNISAEYGSVNFLLKEADGLIEDRAFNAATDKLERALRIRPAYAQAWSRLSWLALQTDSPKRSVQMAKRSNSFAFSNTKLQTLNWSFIRSASKALNDKDTYRQATQKIESLKAL